MQIQSKAAAAGHRVHSFVPSLASLHLMAGRSPNGIDRQGGRQQSCNRGTSSCRPLAREDTAASSRASESKIQISSNLSRITSHNFPNALCITQRDRELKLTLDRDWVVDQEMIGHFLASHRVEFTCQFVGGNLFFVISRDLFPRSQTRHTRHAPLLWLRLSSSLSFLYLRLNPG